MKLALGMPAVKIQSGVHLGDFGDFLWLVHNVW